MYNELNWSGNEINKKNLISLIQNTACFAEPKIEFEQYCIDAVSAVDLIYFAGFEFNDIKHAIVVDLGSGTGRLSIASAFFKAEYVLSVDIDIDALKILYQNVKKLNLEHIILPICADIKRFEILKRCTPSNIKITTIMNPPFGVQKSKADREFLQKAFSFSDVVYSIHLRNEKVQEFIKNFVSILEWRIDLIVPFNLMLAKTYEFHSKKTKEINVNFYRFLKKE